MDFLNDKKDYNKKKGRITFNSDMKFIYGNGGSQNIIHIGDKYVYKIIPFEHKRPNNVKRLNHDQQEIKFYRYLTEDFVMTGKTPHIVGYFDSYRSKLKSLFKKCNNIDDVITKKSHNYYTLLCRLSRALKKNRVKSETDVIVIEKCPESIQGNIQHILQSRKKGVNKNKLVIELINRSVFQIIFTLAIIQQKYPKFVHNDFFLRNIIGTMETKYGENEYVKYNFGKKSFYLPANGFCAKINDFGYTLDGKKFMSTEAFHIDNFEGSMPTINCKKCDVFNFLRDLYWGGDLGTKSLKTIYGKDTKGFNIVRKVMSKYIDVKIIDKANNNAKNKVDWMWSIKHIPTLAKTVKEPADYLKNNTFNGYMKLPKKGVIVAEYN